MFELSLSFIVHRNPRNTYRYNDTDDRQGHSVRFLWGGGRGVGDAMDAEFKLLFAENSEPFKASPF